MIESKCWEQTKSSKFHMQLFWFKCVLVVIGKILTLKNKEKCNSIIISIIVSIENVLSMEECCTCDVWLSYSLFIPPFTFSEKFNQSFEHFKKSKFDRIYHPFPQVDLPRRDENYFAIESYFLQPKPKKKSSKWGNTLKLCSQVIKC